MNPKRKQRLILVLFLVFGFASVVGLVLFALQENINLFYNTTIKNLIEKRYDK